MNKLQDILYFVKKCQNNELSRKLLIFRQHYLNTFVCTK